MRRDSIGAQMDQNKKLFPQRLWELVHDEKYDFCLRWSPDGQRIYLNRNEFEIHYLRTPNNQFHTKKAISFVRQMNMYGFRKVDDCYYENDNFKKNCHHLLKNMVRRHSNKPNSYNHGITSHNGSSSSSSNNNGTSVPSIQCINANSSTDIDSQRANISNNNNGISNNAARNANLNPLSSDSNNVVLNSSLNNINDNNINQAINLNEIHRDQHPITPMQSLFRQFTGMNSANMCNRTASSSHRASPFGSSGTSSPLSNMELAAALASSNTAGLSPSSLNSTLYQRLAALNFSANGNLFCGQQQTEQCQHQQLSHPEFVPTRLVQQSTSESAIDQDLQSSARSSAHQAPIHQQQIEIMNSSIRQQQAIAAPQAVLQQSLVGSFLQLRQTSPVSASWEQSLLSTLRRQSANLVLNQIPFASGITTSAVETTNIFPGSNIPMADSEPSEPLELVVDSSRSSSNSERQINTIERTQSDHRTNDRNCGSMYNLASQSIVSGPSRWSLPCRRDEDFIDDDDADDYYNIDQDDIQSDGYMVNDTDGIRISARDTTSLVQSDGQQFESNDNPILNLAKPLYDESRDDSSNTSFNSI